MEKNLLKLLAPYANLVKTGKKLYFLYSTHHYYTPSRQAFFHIFLPDSAADPSGVRSDHVNTPFVECKDFQNIFIAAIQTFLLDIVNVIQFTMQYSVTFVLFNVSSCMAHKKISSFELAQKGHWPSKGLKYILYQVSKSEI